MERKTQIFIALISLFSSIVTGVIVGVLTKDAAIKSAKIQSNISRVNNQNIIENSREVLELEYKLKRKTELDKEVQLQKEKETVAINYFVSLVENHVNSLEHDYRTLQILSELKIEKIATSVEHYNVEKTVDSIEILKSTLKTYALIPLNNETSLHYIEYLQSALQRLVFKYQLGQKSYRNAEMFDFTSKDIRQLVNLFSSSDVSEEEKRKLFRVYIEKVINQSKIDLLSRGYEITYCLQILEKLNEKSTEEDSHINEKLVKYNKLNKEYSEKYKGLSF